MMRGPIKIGGAALRKGQSDVAEGTSTNRRSVSPYSEHVIKW